jgi:D-alanine-D-alanine ligase
VRIGLTYDLRAEYLALGYGEEETAEFDQQGTIDALAGAIESLGHTVDRIGSARSLIGRLAKGDRWELVFNIAEGLNGYGREAQVPAILDVYGITYTFADPLAASVCLQKGWSKTIVRAAGVPTADFAIIETPADIDRVSLGYPMLAKPIAEGTGKGVTPNSVVRSKADLSQVAIELLDRYRQPVLVETFLPGREFTVGIVGTGDAARAIGWN